MAGSRPADLRGEHQVVQATPGSARSGRQRRGAPGQDLPTASRLRGRSMMAALMICAHIIVSGHVSPRKGCFQFLIGRLLVQWLGGMGMLDAHLAERRVGSPVSLVCAGHMPRRLGHGRYQRAAVRSAAWREARQGAGWAMPPGDRGGIARIRWFRTMPSWLRRRRGPARYSCWRPGRWSRFHGTAACRTGWRYPFRNGNSD